GHVDVETPRETIACQILEKGSQRAFVATGESRVETLEAATDVLTGLGLGHLRELGQGSHVSVPSIDNLLAMCLAEPREVAELDALAHVSRRSAIVSATRSGRST